MTCSATYAVSQHAFVMPDGVASITNEDLGVGPTLVIRMTNGFTVVIDALRLGEHECQLGVYAPGHWEEDGDGEPLATIQFDPVLPCSARTFEPLKDIA